MLGKCWNRLNGPYKTCILTDSPFSYPVSIKHCPVTLDLAFVMDASSDVGRANFQLEKAFAKTVSGKFTITKHQSHIGLITYANLPSLRMRFRQYNSIFGKAVCLRIRVAILFYDTRWKKRVNYLKVKPKSHLRFCNKNWIGHFRVALNLISKARLNAKLFIQRLVLFAYEWKLIYIMKTLHEASLS